MYVNHWSTLITVLTVNKRQLLSVVPVVRLNGKIHCLDVTTVPSSRETGYVRTIVSSGVIRVFWHD